MAGTGLYMNWVNVTATPSTGNAIGIDGVTGMMPGRVSRQEVAYGDARQFARYIKNVEKKRTITIASMNAAALIELNDAVSYTVSGTLLDPKNGNTSGGGAIQVTLVNAVIEKIEINGQNNKYAGGVVTFNGAGAFDTNGNEIDPLTVTAL